MIIAGRVGGVFIYIRPRRISNYSLPSRSEVKQYVEITIASNPFLPTALVSSSGQQIRQCPLKSHIKLSHTKLQN